MSDAMPTHVSETSLCRGRLKRFIHAYDVGVDVGFGGDPICPDAIRFDLPTPYTKVGHWPQHLAGDCRSLPFLDGSLDYIFSSHLIEDFYYTEQEDMILHWAHKLKTLGRIILYCPDQQRFLHHCKKTGQSLNDAHKEKDYSYFTFITRVLHPVNRRLFPLVLKEIYGNPYVENYSWEIVLEKQVAPQAR